MSRVLLYDIENSPIISYNWGIWEQNAVEIVEDWQILTVAWKWLDEKKVYVIGQDDFDDWKPGVNNDKNVVKKIHELFNEADVVIAHNGDSFDQKKSQARMLVHGMQPPSPYRQIDTKKVAKRYARFTSVRLGHLGGFLGVGQKLETGGFATWKGCLAGDPASWSKMKKYNKQDVSLLEEVYLKLRPWIQNHPGLNVLDNKPEACPKCGEGPLQARGFAVSKVGKKQRYQCQSCGGWSQGGTTIKTEVKATN